MASAARLRSARSARRRKLLTALLACALTLGVPAFAASAATPDPAPCAHAKALLDAGEYKAAVTAYTDLLGSTKCAEDVAAQLKAAKSKLKAQTKKVKAAKQAEGAWPRKYYKTATSWTSATGWVLRAYLALLAAVLVAVGYAAWRATRRTVRLQIIAGTGADTVASMTSTLRTVLGEMSSGESASRSGRVPALQPATEPDFSIPKDITKIVPKAAFVESIVQAALRLVPRRSRMISGTVHPPHEYRGAGLTLVVNNWQRREPRHGPNPYSVTIWERDFGLLEVGARAHDEVRYERLVQPAAIWFAFMYNRERGESRWSKLKENFREPRPYSVLGTANWRSYALSSIGDLVSDPLGRRMKFELALDEDDGNLAARVNLGAVLLTHMSEPSASAAGQPISSEGKAMLAAQFEEAEHHLAFAQSRAERAIASVAKDDATGYRMVKTRAVYFRAIRELLDRQLAGDAPRGVDASAVLPLLKKEVIAVRRAVKERGWSDAIGGPVDELLARLAQPAILLCYMAELKPGVAAVNTPEVALKADEWFPRDDEWPTAEGEYVLAWAWTRYAKMFGNSSPEKPVERAVAALRRAIDRRASFRDLARRDPCFDSIRADKSFQDVVKQDAPDAKEERLAITVDPGDRLVELAGGGSAAADGNGAVERHAALSWVFDVTRR